VGPASVSVRHRVPHRVRATTYHTGHGTATPHEGETSDASDARAMRQRSPQPTTVSDRHGTAVADIACATMYHLYGGTTTDHRVPRLLQRTDRRHRDGAAREQDKRELDGQVMVGGWWMISDGCRATRPPGQAARRLTKSTNVFTNTQIDL